MNYMYVEVSVQRFTVDTYALNTKCYFFQIRVAYNNVYRKVLDVYDPSSESEMFATNIILNFEALIRMSIFALIACLSISSNTITHSEILDCRRHNLGKIDGEIVFASLHPLPVIPNFNTY